ncbi:MAG: RNA polymerase sigma-70 factor [Thermomicrobiales bacterium]
MSLLESTSHSSVSRLAGPSTSGSRAPSAEVPCTEVPCTEIPGAEGLGRLGPDWVSRIESGDPAAHEALFRSFAPALYSFLLRYVGSRAIAEDLVQDLFLAIWDHHATMRIEGSVRTYLFTAARNRALNYLKHERVAERFRSILLEKSDESDPSAPGESDFLAALEMQDAIEKLPPRCQLIFTMSRQQDMSYNQIATALGISVKTVEVQMGRALRSLRAHHWKSLV